MLLFLFFILVVSVLLVRTGDRFGTFFVVVLQIAFVEVFVLWHLLGLQLLGCLARVSSNACCALDFFGSVRVSEHHEGVL